jgi:hypothetical protein
MQAARPCSTARTLACSKGDCSAASPICNNRACRSTGCCLPNIWSRTSCVDFRNYALWPSARATGGGLSSSVPRPILTSTWSDLSPSCRRWPHRRGAPSGRSRSGTFCWRSGNCRACRAHHQWSPRAVTKLRQT